MKKFNGFAIVASILVTASTMGPVMADTIIIAEPPPAPVQQYTEPAPVSTPAPAPQPTVSESVAEPEPVEEEPAEKVDGYLPLPSEKSDDNPYSLVLVANVPPQIESNLFVKFKNELTDTGYYAMLDKELEFKNSGYLPKGVYTVDLIEFKPELSENEYEIQPLAEEMFKLNEDNLTYRMEINVDAFLEEVEEPATEPEPEPVPEITLREDLLEKYRQQQEKAAEEPVPEPEPEPEPEPVQEDKSKKQDVNRLPWRGYRFQSAGGEEGIYIDGISKGSYDFEVKIKHSGKRDEATLSYYESRTGYSSGAIEMKNVIDLTLDNGVDTGLKMYCDDVSYRIDDVYRFTFEEEHPLTGATNAPVVMLTGESPTNMNVVIKIEEAGEVGTATYLSSVDGGNKWASERRVKSREEIGSLKVYFTEGDYDSGIEYKTQIQGKVKEDLSMKIIMIVGAVVGVIALGGFAFLMSKRTGKSAYVLNRYDGTE